ncbi:MAG: ATP-dependent Clp protease proteolytic subunit [Phycisphaerae bacterium]
MAVNQHLIPIVIEKTGRGERSYDIYSRLLRDRVVFCGGAIDDEMANTIVAQMLFLANEDSAADINLYVNSPGGSVSAGLAIYDTMQFLRCDVATYGIGMSASMGAVLLAGGAKGKRFILPNSRVLLHQPLLGGLMQGTATDLSIEAREIIRLRSVLYQILAKHSGQSMTKIEKDCDRNLWLDPAEALDYGLVDKILERMPDSALPKRAPLSDE